MSRFHINNKGQPAKCTATERACPLGSEHFSSQRETMDRINEHDLTPFVIDSPLPTITPTGFREYRTARANAQQQAFVRTVLNEPNEENRMPPWLHDWLSSDDDQGGSLTPY